MLNAFLVALAVFICVGGAELIGFTMLNRPIVIGPLVGMFAKKFDQLAAEGKEKQIVLLHYGLWAVNWALYSLVAFLGILFGSDAVSALMDAIPDVVMNGLIVCGGLLPAVGMAMLMKMLWDKKYACSISLDLSFPHT